MVLRGRTIRRDGHGRCGLLSITKAFSRNIAGVPASDPRRRRLRAAFAVACHQARASPEPDALPVDGRRARIAGRIAATTGTRVALTRACDVCHGSIGESWQVWSRWWWTCSSVSVSPLPEPRRRMRPGAVGPINRAKPSSRPWRSMVALRRTYARRRARTDGQAPAPTRTSFLLLRFPRWC
jgi:hypothetical protein